MIRSSLIPTGIPTWRTITDPGSDEITVNGTLQLCEHLAVDPDDIVLLAIAYELKSPRVGEWTRRGWIDGLRNLG